MKLLKRILKSEAGQALPMALILLVLGGFLVVPTLAFMTTNLNATRQIDRKNLELYAADAGVEQILWNIQYNQYDPQDNPGGFKLPTDTYQPPPLEFTLNERKVNVQISKQANPANTYKITSIAPYPDNGHSTTVKCFLNFPPDLAWLFDSAITSVNDVIISNNAIVSGDVTAGGDITLNNNAVIKDGIPNEHDSTLESRWPTCDQLKNFYLNQPQMAGATDPGGTPTLSSNPDYPTLMGPWYHADDLTMSGNGGYGKLDGTVYVTGDFTANNNCTINLNGEAIFAEGTITIGENTVIEGPGAIVACGNVDFACNTGVVGKRLIGVNETLINNPTPVAGSVIGGSFILSRFNPILAGTMSSFHVYCTGPGHVKLAIYDDNGATPPAPTTRLNTIGDNAIGVEVQYGWNTFDINGTGTPMVRKVGNKDKYYWLAANSDADVIGKISQSSTQKWTGLAFPSAFPPSAGTLPNTDNDFTYLFSGWSGGQEFIMVMSVEGSLTMKNNGTFYGSVAAKNGVLLENNDVATLVNVPGDSLNFPGGSGADDDDGAIPTILTYTIK